MQESDADDQPQQTFDAARPARRIGTQDTTGRRLYQLAVPARRLDMQTIDLLAVHHNEGEQEGHEGHEELRRFQMTNAEGLDSRSSGTSFVSSQESYDSQVL